VERLNKLGVGDDRWGQVVDPSVRVPSSCRIGAGSILLAGTVLTAEVTIGRHVVVMPHATLTHDDQLEDFATVCAGVSLAGGVRVGPRAYLGTNASVREAVVVGADAVLGMGSALLSDLPAGETWVGVPARPLGNAR
jgi:acetyltransferase-like isoleucine patch superfamily enzyme